MKRKPVAVSFVLAVEGRCDATKFRPEMDETQWWGRRDALARITAAMVAHGAGANANIANLVFVFDEDGGILRMRWPEFAEHMGDVPPTEKLLVTAWRNAAQRSRSDGVTSGGCDGRAENGDDDALQISWDPAARIVQGTGFSSRVRDAIGQIVAGKSEEARSRVGVLVLHEDARYGLNIFPQTDGNGKDKNDDGDDDDDNKHKRKRKRLRELVCVLGAVRDLRRTEEEAVRRACAHLGMRCCAANLGRTAEFTSKIVMALILHNLNGALGVAADALIAEHSSGDDANKDTFRKLSPVREGGWTWNGSTTFERDKYRKSKSESTKKILNSSHRGQQQEADRHPPSRAEGSSSVTRRGHLHSVLFLDSVTSSSLSTSPKARSSLVIAVHVAVTSLWRSRVTSETTKQNHKQQKQKQDPASAFGNELLPMLSIVFADGVVTTFDRDALLSYMAEHHMAAPTEFQVLSAMIMLAKNKALASEKTYSASKPKTSTSKDSMLVALLRKHHQDPHQTRIIHLLLDNDTESTTTASLSKLIYRRKSGRRHGGGGGMVDSSCTGDSCDGDDIVLLMSTAPSSIASANVRDDCRRFFGKTRAMDSRFASLRVIPDKMTIRTMLLPASERSSLKRTRDRRDADEDDQIGCERCVRMFPSFAVAAIQIWQSQGVLQQALRRLFVCSSHSDGTCDDGGITDDHNDRDDEKKKKKKRRKTSESDDTVSKRSTKKKSNTKKKSD